MPLPLPNATTHPPTSPSVNDTDRNTERGGVGGVGHVGGESPVCACGAHALYVSSSPPPMTDIDFREGHSGEVMVGESGEGRGAVDAHFGEEGGVGGRGDGDSSDGRQITGDEEGV